MFKIWDCLSASLRGLVDLKLTALEENEAEWKSDGALRRNRKACIDKKHAHVHNLQAKATQKLQTSVLCVS